MSLNFYAGIDNFKIDSKDNTSIAIKLPSGGLAHQLDLLRQLKDQSVVHILVETAVIEYEEEVDIEDQQAKMRYFKDVNGKWTSEMSEQTNLLGDDGYQKTSKQITADVVDQFLQTQSYDYGSDFKPKSVLNMMSEGYDYDDIAKQIKMTTITMLDELNKARDIFAPYAAAWQEEQQQKEDN
ncbi:DNA primase [Lactiplantibacillus plantarum]|uniref:DNA primase n=1 Tax=Lactiplantibacillus plantarum TaxID=1590 RepID=UPI0021A41D0E|nr:DNA primase [Lactiplantibacillus plantarum]MCT3214677.1 DNA primase [Lactiplantibacillus plantarum]MCT3272325.1 DNA primase [Lactiplantibacillus plantarum]